MWAHSQTIKNLEASHPVLVQVERYPDYWCNRTPGLKRGDQLGFSVGALRTGQLEVLGSLVPVMLHYGSSLHNFLGWPDRWGGSNLRFNIGSGLAYSTRPFNLQTNPGNSAVGSRITWALQWRGGIEFRLKHGLYLETGLGIYHNSNGAFRLPNLGLNVPHAYLILDIPTYGKHNRWELNPITKKPIRNRPDPVDTMRYTPGPELWVNTAAGLKMADYGPSKLYGTYALRLMGLWRASARSGFTTSLDWIHHRALRAESVFYNEPLARDYNRIGLAAGHDWFIARGIVLSGQLGWYLRNPAPGVHKPYYQRFGVRFNTSGRISPAILLRFHLGQADCLEWTLGWRLYSTNK